MREFLEGILSFSTVPLVERLTAEQVLRRPMRELIDRMPSFSAVPLVERLTIEQLLWRPMRDLIDCIPSFSTVLSSKLPDSGMKLPESGIIVWILPGKDCSSTSEYPNNFPIKDQLLRLLPTLDCSRSQREISLWSTL